MKTRFFAPGSEEQTDLYTWAEKKKNCCDFFEPTGHMGVDGGGNHNTQTIVRMSHVVLL